MFYATLRLNTPLSEISRVGWANESKQPLLDSKTSIATFYSVAVGVSRTLSLLVNLHLVHHRFVDSANHTKSVYRHPTASSGITHSFPFSFHFAISSAFARPFSSPPDYTISIIENIHRRHALDQITHLETAYDIACSRDDQEGSSLRHIKYHT